MGAHCMGLRVTLRIGELEEGPASLDHEATWLLGHTERISFAELWEDEGDLYVEAVLHVPCRYLHQKNGRSYCQAHGFRGPMPRGPRRLEQPLCDFSASTERPRLVCDDALHLVVPAGLWPCHGCGRAFCRALSLSNSARSC